MTIIIDNKSGVPIYDQIYSQIKAQIIGDALRQDEALPSIRSLAKDLRISVITTKRAYDELEAEGFIYTLPRQGQLCRAENTDCSAGGKPAPHRRAHARNFCTRRAERPDAAGTERDVHIDFRGGVDMNAIEITGLRKAYPDFELAGLDLCLPGGCIMGLIGENGAGKSTTIRLILDMIKPDAGSIKALWPPELRSARSRRTLELCSTK